MNATIRNTIFIGFLLAFLFSIKYTSWVQSWTGMGDMRWRVVGARQIDDGISPYYRGEYLNDPPRYIQNIYIDTGITAAYGVELANLTTSPFFLRTVSIFSEYDEYRIDWGVYIFCHLAFLICIALALLYAERKHWPLCLLLFIPITLTDGWIYHFFVVQQYILFGFLLTIICLLLLRNKQIAAGILFALLILLRLNTVIFIVPFVLLAWNYRKFLLSSAIGVAVYAIFAFVHPMEKKLWQDYFSSLKVHQAIQMNEKIQTNRPRHILNPNLPANFEGTDYVKMDSVARSIDFEINKESSNFRAGYKAVFKQYPSVTLLVLLLVCSVGITLLWQLFQRYRPKGLLLPAYKVATTGLFFYFLSNFFSTVYTAPYHLPQWWAVGFIYTLNASKIPRVALGLFVLGMIVNCHFMPSFPGKHLLGEMVLLASVLWVIIMPSRAESQASSAVASSTAQH